MKKFKAALVVFEEKKKYNKTVKSFKSLKSQAKYPTTKDTAQGLVTASYYGAGRHEDGLAYICKEYEGLPVDDIRHLYRIHAHIRRIALTEGYGVAETVTRTLRDRCGRSDFSYVWAGIPLAMMEYLSKGWNVLEEAYRLSDSGRDKEYLRYVIKRYPDDAFLDHAYYFLQNFETVARSFPESRVGEHAVFLAAAIPLGYHVSHYVDGVSPGFYYPSSANHLTQPTKIKENLSLLLDKYPNSKYTNEAVKGLYVAHLLEGNYENAIDLYTSRKPPSSAFYELKLLRHAQSAADRNTAMRIYDKALSAFPTGAYTQKIAKGFFDLLVVSGKLERSLGIHSRYGVGKIPDDWNKAATSNKDDGGKLFQSGKFEEALHYYDKIDIISRNLGFGPLAVARQRANEISLLLEATANSEATKVIDYGIELKNRKLPKASNAVLWLAYEMESDPAVSERALFLIAQNHKKIQRRLSLETFSLFVVRFPNSNLIDDVYGEIGIYYCEVIRDCEKATVFFKEIISKYADGNAADNALHWLAKYYQNSGDYMKAVRYYALLSKTLVSQKLSGVAKEELRRLNPIKRALDSGKRFSGVTLDLKPSSHFRGLEVLGVEQGSYADKANLDVGDVLISIRGEEVLQPEDYYKIMSTTPDGEVNIVIERKGERHEGELLVISER